MKKVKILIMTFITLMITFLITIITNNISFAADYSGLGGVDAILASDPTSVLNKTINLSFKDVTSSGKLYCMEQGQKNKSTPYPYKICQYIEINGTECFSAHYGVGGNYAEHSNSTGANAVLAEILSGKYGAGYGASSGAYSDAQRGLYVYFPEWIQQSGIEGGLGIDHSWDAGSGYTDNGVGASIVSAAKNSVYNDGSRSYVKIFLLDNAADTDWQRLMIIEGGYAPEEEEEEPKDTNYNGYIKIQGKVWVDGKAGKANEINGKYGDASDKGLGGITVKLLDSGGSEFKGGSSAVTKSDGSYEIVVNYDTRYNVYKLWENPETVHNKLMGAYVQFYYNGFKYTTVAAANKGANTSKATEDYSTRTSYDKSNTRVGPNTGTPDGNVTASTQSMISFSSYAHQTTEKQSVTILYCNADGSPKTSTSQSSSSKGTYLQTADNEWETPVTLTGQNMHYKDHYVDDYDRPIYTQDKIGEDEETGEPIYGEPYWTGKYYQKFDWREFCPNYSNGHSIKTTTITNLVIKHVNLGLFEREQPDIALTSDISSVDVIMNGQKYTYKYNNHGSPSYNSERYFSTVKFQNKYTYTYKRPVNPADVGYVNDGHDNAMEVYVTYKITLANQSSTLPVTVNKIVSDFDSQYTIVSDNWGSATDKGEYKEAVSKDLSIVIPVGKTKTTTVKYKVSQEAIKGLIKQNATLNNVFEIHTYSTQYGANTLCAQQSSGAAMDRTNDAYAGRDTDSQPGNAGVKYSSGKLKVSNGQDDTDIAPSFVLCIDEYRVISGTVYEDKQDSKNTANTKNNERLGNGILDSGEKGIANVKVELLHTDGTPANLYKINRANGTKERIKPVTYTDANGNFSFGTNAQYGVVVDDYILKYTYGNDKNELNGKVSTLNGVEINARNFKSTIVKQDPIKSIMKGTNTSRKWHLETADSTTVAVDDLGLRKTATDDVALIYSNFGTPINMSAYSKPFDLQVEYTANPSANVKEDGTLKNGTFEHTWTRFDFGIIERAREDLVVDKTIENIKITLANGQILVEGNPYAEKLNYVKALGTKNVSTRSDYLAAKAKLLYIEMDSELIQGARIDITYKITVTNNSEKDYEYGTGKEGYYYFGDKSGLGLIKTTVDEVVDYIDPELTCTVGEDATNAYNKTGWTQVSAQQLYDEGKISKDTFNKLDGEKYLIFTTDYFKDVSCYDDPETAEKENQKSKYIFASKLLANQADEYTYENHAEIIKVNGKIARTIDSVNDNNRKQVVKTYMPGNYIPSTANRFVDANGTRISEGLHQPDDDRIIVRITPPTGLLDNSMIYIVTGMVALIVLVAGTIIIKKKVLRK